MKIETVKVNGVFVNKGEEHLAKKFVEKAAEPVVEEPEAAVEAAEPVAEAAVVEEPVAEEAPAKGGKSKDK